VHLVLAHHGRLEYGSPKVPATLEALLTHELDEIDSRVNSWLNLMGREAGNRRWTSSDNVYGQHIWRGTLPTAQVEKKGPPPELMTPVIYVPREGAPRQGGGGGGGGQGQGQGGGKKQRPPRPERRPEPRPDAASAAAGGAAPAAAGGGSEAPAAARPEGGGAPPERRERPERGPRPDRGGPGGFRGGPGGPGDRKRGYTGPRLPGDRGPQPRPKAAAGGGSLTHNPFAALAQKIEGGGAPAGGETPHEEPAAAAPPTEAEAPASPPAEAAPEPQAAAPAEPAPAAPDAPPEGQTQQS
jgi:3'-5' exoribonuclease